MNSMRIAIFACWITTLVSGVAVAQPPLVVAYDFDDDLTAAAAADKSNVEPLMPAELDADAQLVDDDDPARGRVLLTSEDGFGAFAEHTSKLDFTTSFTLQGWVKVDEGPAGLGWRHIAGQPGSGARIFDHYGIGALGAVHLNNDDTWAPVNFGDMGTGPDGEWHHVLMTWDQTTQLLYGYYDGELAGASLENRNPRPRAGTEKAILAGRGFGIGGNILDDNGTNQFPSSYIDDVAYWSEYVTEEQAKGLADGTFTIFNVFDPIGSCDLNGDGVCDTADIDFMAAQGSTLQERIEYIGAMKPDGLNSYLGDSNLDGVYDDQDIVSVFIPGLYLTGNAATYAQGDWDGDMDFDEQDIVASFIQGDYLKPARPDAVSAVPEPSSGTLIMLGMLVVLRRRR